MAACIDVHRSAQDETRACSWSGPITVNGAAGANVAYGNALALDTDATLLTDYQGNPQAVNPAQSGFESAVFVHSTPLPDQGTQSLEP